MHAFILVASICAMAWMVLRFPKFGWGKAALLSLLLMLLTAWWFIDRLSGDGLNAATLYHLRAGMEGAGVSDFSKDIALCVLLLVASLSPFALLRVRRFNKQSRRRGMGVFIASLLVAVAASPLIRDGKRLYRQMKPADAMAVTGEYRVPESALTRKPNIVWIYGESLERTYMDEEAFPGLMPNMHRLAAEGLDFRDVMSTDGTGWTIAGMVASQCGVPLTAAQGDENSFGRMGSFMPQAQCLGDYLHKQGYRNAYLGGADGAFAGKGDFLRSHGYDDIRDLAAFRKDRTIRSSHFSAWGVHDDVLLEQAWTQFQQLSQADQPFMLTALTMDTHHPAGHLPLACKGQHYAGTGGRVGMLDAIACSDRLISRFVDRIRESTWADNTIVVIASDHLAMPNDLSETLAGMQRENLLLVLGKDVAPRQLHVAAGSTLDSGATLLHVMDPSLQTLGFGRSLLSPRAAPSASAAARKDDGATYPRYLAYARNLWTGQETRTLRVQDDKVMVGVQEVRPPVLLDYDKGWRLAGITLEDVPRRFQAATPKNTLAYVDRCTAFDDESPDTGWCAMLVNHEQKARLYRAEDLAAGVRVDNPLQRWDGMRQQLRQPVMLGDAIRGTRPGQYEVKLSAIQQPLQPFWIEAITAQGELLGQYRVFPDREGRIRMPLGLDVEVDDMQIRAWLSVADDLLLDDIALVRAPRLRGPGS
jgi:phosphoglycerol transferase